MYRYVFDDFLNLLQILATVAATSIEKLQFAFDWSCRRTTILSLAIVWALCLQLAVTVFVSVKFLGPSVLRFLLLQCPFLAVAFSTDPEFLKKFKIVEKLDSFACCIVAWQPESQLVTRCATNIWDYLYLNGLISDQQRYARITQRESPDLSENRRISTWIVEDSKRDDDIAVYGPTATTPPRKKGPTDRVDIVGASIICSESGRKTTNLSTEMLRLILDLIKICLLPFNLELLYISNWFLRLPDRREIEHRQICTTQYIGPDFPVDLDLARRSLETLLVSKDSGSPSVSKDSVAAVVDPSQNAAAAAAAPLHAWYTPAGARKNVEAMKSNILKSMKWDDKPPPGGDVKPAAKNQWLNHSS